MAKPPAMQIDENTIYQVTIETDRTRTDALGSAGKSARAVQEFIVAPMPGRIVRVLATVKPKRQSTAGLAAVFDVDDDGTKLDLKFTQFHPMPGGQLKFCVLRDEKSQMFWATANLVVDSQGIFEWWKKAEKSGVVRYANGLGGNPKGC